jgi:hypothetical protein
MKPNDAPDAPLHLPLRTTVDGVEVTGEIVSLTPNDMRVVIGSPVSGLGTMLHVPHFAMVAKGNWLATDGNHITERGQQRAEELLKKLYAHAMGRPSRWGISKVSPDGVWTDL